MIIFNIKATLSPDGHTSSLPLMVQTSRWWGCSDEGLSDYGDYALAVIDNIIVNVYRINGWVRDPDQDNNAVLDLEELPQEHLLRGWISQTAPVRPNPGQTNFQYLSLRDSAFAPAQLVNERFPADPVHDEIYLLSYL